MVGVAGVVGEDVVVAEVYETNNRQYLTEYIHADTTSN